mmetsp:Transcript_12926/g.42982  ORF Transcript_12926/g.42982 Transcript_12926/m.42982 type:complete len:200 (-) Transcript_12926:215-814(-)
MPQLRPQHLRSINPPVINDESSRAGAALHLVVALRGGGGQRRLHLDLRLAGARVRVREDAQRLCTRRRPDQKVLAAVTLDKEVVGDVVVRLREATRRGGPELQPRPPTARRLGQQLLPPVHRTERLEPTERVERRGEVVVRRAGRLNGGHELRRRQIDLLLMCSRRVGQQRIPPRRRHVHEVGRGAPLGRQPQRLACQR